MSGHYLCRACAEPVIPAALGLLLSISPDVHFVYKILIPGTALQAMELILPCGQIMVLAGGLIREMPGCPKGRRYVTGRVHRAVLIIEVCHGRQVFPMEGHGYEARTWQVLLPWYGACQAVTQKSWPGTQTVLFTEGLLLRKRDSDGLAHDKNR